MHQRSVKSLAYQLKKRKSLFPALSEEYSSVHINGAARVNGRSLRNALISAAKEHGATFIKGDAVLVREGNRITGVTVNDEKIVAEKVIVTAGAWANEILNPLGINFLSFSPKRTNCSFANGKYSNRKYASCYAAERSIYFNI